MAEGSRRRLAYIEEAAWGTTPGTPTLKAIRNTGGSGIMLERSQIQSQEMRSDRAIADIALGQKRASLEIPLEFSFDSFHDLLEGALFGDWSPKYEIEVETATFASKTITVTFDPSGDLGAMKKGDRFTVEGASGNGGVLTVDEINGLVITTEEILESETLSSGATIKAVAETLKQGTAKKSYTIEEAFLDDAKYQTILGAIIDTFNLSISPDAIVTGSIGLIGKTASTFGSTAIGSSYVDAGTSEVFDAFNGEIKENDTEIGYITDFSLSLANNLGADYALYATEAFNIGAGRANVSGSLTLFFKDEDILNKAINGTETSLSLKLESPSGDYTIVLPRVKLAPAGKSVEENRVTVSLNWQALYDGTEETTMVIEREAK